MGIARQQYGEWKTASQLLS